MSAVKNVDVSIMGRDFRIACPEEEEEGLLAAVDFLDKRMGEIRDSGKLVGVERIAIMAALNITNELLNTRTGGVDIGGLQRRINSMQERLDQALLDQEALF
ncbi:MAG: cell division protein ZapA [Methylophilales bacterium]|nr:cell division protein ZapA [Methylophilales bacterium]